MSPEAARSIRDAVDCELCKAQRRHRCRNKHGMPMTHQVRVLADLFKTNAATNTEQGAPA